MSEQSVSATLTVRATAAAVFDVLTDPARHAGIDGTGWVVDTVDAGPLREVGQVFRMSMFHPDHPDGAYETLNEVTLLEPGRTIAWRTGYLDTQSGRPAYAGWWWRYDLQPVGPGRTDVTLTYDWSDVGPGPRAYLTFPVFADGHLEGSLERLAGLVAGSQEGGADQGR